ncbi:MAG: FAD binding domain-containing protein, partial [Actinomycetota bacterium]
MDYLVPDGLAAAVAMKAAGGTVLAGGTDLYPQHVGRPVPGTVVDISGLEELRGITEAGDTFRIGGLTRWAEVAAAPFPPCFEGLRAAAREVGSVQVQNAGTVAGNLCNASPAADGIPPLLTLDASVEMTSPSGTRVLPLEDFLTGYRQTALGPDELVTAVLVPREREEARAGFSKLGLRRYLVISVVMVAVTARIEGGVVTDARVAVGACSPVARRLRTLEADLEGRQLEGIGAAATAAHLAALTPIDDVRATAAYRLDAALTLVRRTLAGLGDPR